MKNSLIIAILLMLGSHCLSAQMSQTVENIIDTIFFELHINDSSSIEVPLQLSGVQIADLLKLISTDLDDDVLPYVTSINSLRHLKYIVPLQSEYIIEVYPSYPVGYRLDYMKFDVTEIAEQIMKMQIKYAILKKGQEVVDGKLVINQNLSNTNLYLTVEK